MFLTQITMENNFKHWHLYWNAKCRYKNEWGVFEDTVGNRISRRETNFKPILRSLKTITYEEAICIDADFIDLDHQNQTVYQVGEWNEYKYSVSSEDFIYLLDAGFDLFGLIESGQAIELKLR